MATQATVFRVDLAVADMDRPYYGNHSLRVARHPSETDERMMVRVLAFALHAHESLEFGRGLSTEEDPDLWQKDLTGNIQAWIEVGQPDEKRLRRACQRATKVWVYNYGGRSAELWWQQNREPLERLENLTLLAVPPAASQGLAALVQRSMALQCTIQEGQVWMGNGEQVVALELLPRRGVRPDT